MMNDIFWNLIVEGIVVVYLDNILIFTKTEEEHAQVVRQVLQVLKENKTDIQAFLGFVNFYWRFIRDFSAKAQPLFDLTHSEQVWTWSRKEQAAFEDLITAVTTALVLVSPQESDLFQIEADSSDFATGAVLSQQSTTDRK